MDYAYINYQISQHQIITINVLLTADFVAYKALYRKEEVTGDITENS